MKEEHAWQVKRVWRSSAKRSEHVQLAKRIETVVFFSKKQLQLFLQTWDLYRLFSRRRQKGKMGEGMSLLLFKNLLTYIYLKAHNSLFLHFPAYTTSFMWF